MTKIYTRHSTGGVYVVKRQDPSERSNNRRRGRHHGEADTVELASRAISEEQLYVLLNERVAFHLSRQLQGAPFAFGFDPKPPGSKSPASESAAFSIFRFATKHYGDFKASYPLLGDGEGRLQFATLIVSALDDAIDDVLDLVLGLTDSLDDKVIGSVEKLRELTINILSDFVEGGAERV